MSRPLLSALLLLAAAGCGKVQTPGDPPPAASQKTVAIAVTPAATQLQGATLRAVRARGEVVCGVNEGFIGFAYKDNRGLWRGFDTDFCRALAAATLGKASAARFVPETLADRFPALISGQIDVLWRNTSWTFSRDAGSGVDFAGVNYYDGQGFMVRRTLAMTSASELNGAKICVQAGSTSELNLVDWARAKGIKYRPVLVKDIAQMRDAYARELCDAYSADVSEIASSRGLTENPSAHEILPDVISKEALGPAVREGDDQWTDVVRWTLYALVLAEEFDITADNVDELRATSINPEVRRLLGVEGGFGAKLGLDNEWAYRAIKAEGNYGEIFDRNVGKESALRLDRGLNALWNDKKPGLMYAPPMR
jgi:general L-amino acid transport system substrate-binding protein